MADGSKLAEVLVQTRAPLETGPRGLVPIELSALGRFEDVDRFFRQLALSPRLIDVESLLMAHADRVRITTVLNLPYRPARAPLPPPPEGARALAQQTPRPQVEAFLKDQSLAVAKSETIAELRRTKRNPRLFLSELAGVVRDRPVVFTRASLGDEFLVSGLTVGEANMRSLETRLERGFFRVAEVLVARQGACHRFEVRGRSPVVGLDAEIPLPNEDPFDQEETACRVDRDAGRPTIVRNAASRVPAKGSLQLRLRDLDLADVFQVIHLLTDQAFLVDEDVHGRVSMDLSGVDGDQALAALEKTGIVLSSPGAFRRVSLTRGKEPPGERRRGRPQGHARAQARDRARRAGGDGGGASTAGGDGARGISWDASASGRARRPRPTCGPSCSRPRGWRSAWWTRGGCSNGPAATRKP